MASLAEETAQMFGPYHIIWDNGNRHGTLIEDKRNAKAYLQGKGSNIDGIPQILAWPGPLPENFTGFDFHSFVEPDLKYQKSHIAKWSGHEPREGLSLKKGMVTMEIVVGANNQDQHS